MDSGDMPLPENESNNFANQGTSGEQKTLYQYFSRSNDIPNISASHQEPVVRPATRHSHNLAR